MAKRSDAPTSHYRAGFAIAIVWVALAFTPMLSSCGSGGGGGGTNGGLCDQCGATDGACVSPFHLFAANDEERQLCEGVSGNPDDCMIKLTCVRKLDSAQRLCFPIEEDRAFECDGERAGATPAPTATPTPTATATVTSTAATPTSTGPTPTGATPTATATPTVTGPTTTPTPEPVSFTVDRVDEDPPTVSQFTVTVTYPLASGTFQVNGSAASCTAEDDDLESVPVTATDNGSGTLTTSVTGASLALPIEITCQFVDKTGSGVDDLVATVNDSNLEVTEPDPA